MKDMRIDVTRPAAELHAAGVTVADLVEAGFLEAGEMEGLRGGHRIRRAGGGDWLAWRKRPDGGLPGREPDHVAPSEDAVLLGIALGHLREHRDIPAERVRLAAEMVAAGASAWELVADGISLDDLVAGGLVSNAEAAAVEALHAVAFRPGADSMAPCWEGREVAAGTRKPLRPDRPDFTGHSAEEVWVAIALDRLRAAEAAEDDYRGADAD